MKRLRLASYGTCPECSKVVGVLSSGALREHRADQRLNPHAVATVDCLGSGRRWVEYDADVAAAGTEALPPVAVNPDSDDDQPTVLDLDAAGRP